MKPYYQDDYITELHGHVISVLQEMSSESIHCIVTSPPYWGLRDYGLEPQIWDGKDGCVHEWGDESISKANDSNRGTMEWTTGGHPAAKIKGEPSSQGQFCQKCGAWLGSLGLEPTPELYIQHIVQIWRELKRVLRKDGVCFLNIGDSYVASGGHTKSGENACISGGAANARNIKSKPVPFNLKIKDLCMIPARVALALQADGWWLRSDIIWNKPNPMPESVTDRPTNSYEHVFLLTKSARYYYDQEAVRETDHPDGRKQTIRRQTNRYDGKLLSPFQDGEHERWSGSRNLRNVWKADNIMARLRKDISNDQKQYVISELLKRGLI